MTSNAPGLFSSGLDSTENISRKVLIKSVNEVAAAIGKLDKATIAVFSGVVDSNSFGVFAGAKYRLGTSSTQFQVRDLLHLGRLPLGGGLVYHLTRSSKFGYAMARYLAVSGRVLTAHDLYMMGLLTHIVVEEPHVHLTDALAHTCPPDDQLKAQQSSLVDSGAVQQLLDSMHIYSGAEGEASAQELDVLAHPVWEKALLVSPQPIPLDSFFDSAEARAREEDLEDVSVEVVEVFRSHNASECRQRLQNLADKHHRARTGTGSSNNSSSWAQDTLQHWDSIAPALLEEWFSLTKLAASESLAGVYALEEKLAAV